MLNKQEAYEKWLGIKQHAPATLYRLLGVEAFESDADIISNAADSRMGFIRQFQAGQNQAVAAEVLNELAQARVVLLNAEKKAAYDRQLRETQPGAGVPVPPLPARELYEIAPPAPPMPAAAGRTAQGPSQSPPQITEADRAAAAAMTARHQARLRELILQADRRLRIWLGAENDILLWFLRIVSVVLTVVALLLAAWTIVAGLAWNLEFAARVSDAVSPFPAIVAIVACVGAAIYAAIRLYQSGKPPAEECPPNPDDARK